MNEPSSLWVTAVLISLALVLYQSMGLAWKYGKQYLITQVQPIQAKKKKKKKKHTYSDSDDEDDDSYYD